MWCWIIFLSGISIISANPTDAISRKIKTRIIGGKEINIEDAPYQVSVLNVDEGSICSGSIISADYLLTAGHCADASAESYVVLSGTSIYYEGGEKHYVIDVTRHENYLMTSKQVPHNDIAVMKVIPPFKLNGKTEKIIELFDKNEKVKDGQAGTVSGWGLTQNGEGSNQLKGLSVNFVPKSTCEENYEDQGGLAQNQLCATHFEGNGDFCQGDSGGPLVVDGRLAGLVSWSKGCAFPGRPGVYTEIAAYRDWIDEKIKA